MLFSCLSKWQKLIWNKKAFFHIIFHYIKQIDSMLLCVCQVIDHRGRQNVVRTSVTHSAAPRVPLFCLYHILTSSVIYYWTAGLELKKISKSPFGDYWRKNGHQMQKCSRQIVQEQKLKLGPHLISIAFGLPVDCFRGCWRDRNTRYART